VSYFHEEQQFRQPAILLPALLLGPGDIAAIALLFALACLVVDVDREAITVAFHFLWPKRRIRVSDVRKAEATKYTRSSTTAAMACGSASAAGHST
jgi:hypothetical protein